MTEKHESEAKMEMLHSALNEGSIKMTLVRDYVERFDIKDMRLVAPLVDISCIFHKLLEDMFDGDCQCNK